MAQRLGKYPPPPGASDIPGLEVSGEVVAVGCAANGFKEGDKVCALITGGGYAEYAVADAALTLPLPSGLSFFEGAALPETYFTAWSNLFWFGGLKTGDVVLVHGGASGVGIAAIQIASQFGATVAATVGSEAKRDACVLNGATTVVNYKTSDVRTRF